MPIWIPLTVLAVAPITTWIVCAYIDMEPTAAASLGLVVPAGAALVLVNRTLVVWIAGRRAPASWADWRGSLVVHARVFSP